MARELGIRTGTKESTLCTNCKKNKKHIKQDGTQDRWCLICNREYHNTMYHKHNYGEKQKEYYNNNKEKIKKQCRKSVKKIKLALRKILFKWKKQPCVDCGIQEPLIIDPDHVRGNKINNISRMISSTCTEKELRTELAKCDPRCANCHRLITAKKFGYYKDLIEK
jgi:hypothetical protein